MNADRYKSDLDTLLDRGTQLQKSMLHEFSPEKFVRAVKSSMGDKAEQFIRSLPSFHDEYQPWYSEAKALVSQLLPDRLDDFCRYYEKPKSRKDITASASSSVRSNSVGAWRLGMT